MESSTQPKRWRQAQRGTQLSFLTLMVFSLVGLLFIGSFTSTVKAQNSGIKRTGFGITETRRVNIDELVKQLMDSERERHSGFDINERIRTNTSGTSREYSDNELRQVRQLIEDFAAESSVLTDAVDTERRRLPAVRPLFSEVLKIRARAHYLSQNAQKAYSSREIVSDFSEIDQSFRLLSTQLRQVRGLSRNVAQPVIRMEKLDKEISALLQVKPQVDIEELRRQTSVLSAGFRNLIDDLEYELEYTSDRTQLLTDGHRIYQQADYLARTVANNSSHEQIQREYDVYKKLWSPYETRLRKFSNRYVERNIRRINQADREVRELLWMEHTVDRSELLYLTKSLMSDVDEFFDRAPLKLLIGLNQSDVISISDEFYGVCENFADNVKTGDEDIALVDSFNYIEDSWRLFYGVFRNVKSQKAHSVLNEIDSRIQALRAELHITDDYFDRRAAIDLASAIDSYASRITYDAERWIGNKNTPTAQQARRDAQDFVQGARQLHSNLVEGDRIATLNTECEELFRKWAKLHTYIPRVDERTRVAMQRTSAQLTPLLVDLQTMLSSYNGTY